MSGGQLLEILILAGIAGFFIYRLNSVLGKRDEGIDEEDLDEVARLNLNKMLFENEQLIEINEKLRPALAKIQKLDRDFSPETFIGGAEKAFRMIIEAYNDGKIEEIKPFLAPDIFKKFTSTIKARNKAGEVSHNNLLRMKSSSIEKVELARHTASITVKFETEQIIAYADENGNLMDGDFNEIHQITDMWTFSRDLTADNPNWVLVKTA